MIKGFLFMFLFSIPQNPILIIKAPILLQLRPPKHLRRTSAGCSCDSQGAGATLCSGLKNKVLSLEFGVKT